MTIVIALLGHFLLPSSPCASTFLTPRERYIASERLYREHGDCSLSRSRASVIQSSGTGEVTTERSTVGARETDEEKVNLKHVYRAMANWNNTFCMLGYCMGNITVQSFALFLVSTYLL